ncbi:hypothetical protein [Acidithiobacillus ferriphilus]|uniref:hypothetical protein n=1 Tax=Acidithiobacillus ferriphilus TaxID=1689834 RepID=UPI001C070735|nr:hypothetical protein [Acidithiobacillus ferriphilus]MDA8152204.1 hypothetical protein [Acidithiobacillus sp.]MBU2829563.1 hypothetical protein [Acidithiobacillus ferriphilus]MBU2833050.1 hypothetical protein [Acidithiobacillus ferriphilus]MBU2853624.1 hypothetical protein [Acidithiobacillus ferriphilus]MDA8181514.1 hypothetical protein [Acidithiobacillus sp.]
MKQQGLMQATIYASAILAGTLWCASPAWADTASSSEAPPSKPVGQAPAEQSRPPAIETLISTTGVLTPAGKFVIEPFIQYTHSSSSIAAVQGFVLAQVLAIGNINIQQYTNDTAYAGVTFRYGVSNRLEMDLRVPFVYAQQNTAVSNLTNNGVQQAFNSTGSGLGDIELSMHYQINKGGNGSPYYIANLQVKSMTGSSPFSMPTYQSYPAGILEQQPTGTGFWGVQPSLTVLYPSDPAVFYGNVSYLWNIGHNAAGTYISPGNAIGFGFGAGLSLNDRASISLGYNQSIVSAPKVGGITPPLATTLEVGSFLVGWSYTLNKSTSINLNLAVGATRQAPDVQLTLRVPYTL